LEFSASVGFIHNESVTMHGHMIVKKGLYTLLDTIACQLTQSMNIITFNVKT